MAILIRDTAFGRTLSLFTKPSGLNPHRATADTDIHPSKNEQSIWWTGPVLRTRTIPGTGHHGSSCWSCAMC
ncbi:hypothetical protein N7505_011306 [Penicillium chrysogenum]|uniref:Uncharacterized protein n=1 Tax=Penicillium chrysogenum TaxID=5076 RepID=A0ABQ8W7G6_PENCH|nr:hypothetical protein N7505_011306 [Penicillium chrysogenum]